MQRTVGTCSRSHLVRGRCKVKKSNRLVSKVRLTCIFVLELSVKFASQRAIAYVSAFGIVKKQYAPDNRRRPLSSRERWKIRQLT